MPVRTAPTREPVVGRGPRPTRHAVRKAREAVVRCYVAHEAFAGVARRSRRRDATSPNALLDPPACGGGGEMRRAACRFSLDPRAGAGRRAAEAEAPARFARPAAAARGPLWGRYRQPSVRPFRRAAPGVPDTASDESDGATRASTTAANSSPAVRQRAVRRIRNGAGTRGSPCATNDAIRERSALGGGATAGRRPRHVRPRLRATGEAPRVDLRGARAGRRRADPRQRDRPRAE